MAESAAPVMLDEFDDSFTTAQEKSRFSAKDMVDGDYEFAIHALSFKSTKAGPLVSFEIEALDAKYGGKKFEHSYFLKMKDKETGQLVTNEGQLAQLRKDLETIGFDAKQWTPENGRKFSVEINRAAKLIAGIRFKGKKKTNGEYHNLYVNERLVADGRPAKFGQKELAEADVDPFSGVA
jgi:hypothetical protein